MTRSIKDLTVPDLTGSLAVVTGASDGIGLGLAEHLARAGAEVILPVRNAAKGDAALARIQAAAPGATVSTRPLDLALLASVAALGRTLRSEARPINLLVNIAAVMAPPDRHVTADGYELQFATDHLGHVALMAHLMPLLRTGGARVTTVSSFAARGARIAWDDLQSERSYAPMKAYGQSKLALMLFALELDRRSRADGWGITSNVAHPGLTSTNLQASGPNLGAYPHLADGSDLPAAVETGAARPDRHRRTATGALRGDQPGGARRRVLRTGWTRALHWRAGRAGDLPDRPGEADARRIWQVSEQLAYVEFATV